MSDVHYGMSEHIKRLTGEILFEEMRRERVSIKSEWTEQGLPFSNEKE